MKHFNLLNNFRWFATIILLITLGIGQMWGANSGLTASPGVFILDFYNSDALSSTTGTGLNTTNCRSHVTVQANATASNIISGVTVNKGTVQFDKNGGLTLGTSSAGQSQVTISVGTKFLIRKIVVVGTKYDDVPLYVAGTSVSLNSKGTAYASCTNSTTIETNFISSFAIKQNNGTDKKRSTLYTAVCEYGYRATISAPGTGSISAAPKTAKENGAGWDSSLGAVVGLYSGQKVTLTATPPTGYEVDAWTIRRTSNNSDVTASVLSGTTLTMPAYDVTISVTWRSTVTCSANPSIGNASLNGSFNLNSIPLQASVSSDGGTGCSITEAGFVWTSDGTDPTISNNKTTGTYSTNITGTIPSAGSFSTGVTYKIKAYATNGHGDGLSSSSFTLIPRSVTFNLNGHGNSAPSVQYVNNDGLATDPSYSESVTGYTFGGWYKEAGCSNAWTFGTDEVSGENKILYAKWTAKTTTVSFNQNSGTGGQTGTLTATYGSAMPGAPVTCPTRTGYNFGGYYDGSGGTGTQYYTNAGASARSWDKDAATATLYAKWTAKSFTVTWMVNGVAYTPSGSGGTDGSTSVDFGSHVATLPTAPTPPCGDKFVGWSTTNIGAVGQATDAGLNLFTTAGDAPVINAEGTVTYYAVFADYDE